MDLIPYFYSHERNSVFTPSCLYLTLLYSQYLFLNGTYIVYVPGDWVLLNYKLLPARCLLQCLCNTIQMC